MKKFLFLCLTIPLLWSCKKESLPTNAEDSLERSGNIPLVTVENVDLERYQGLWYEIASYPQFFSKSCNCTQAEYYIRSNGSVKVINTCRLGSTSGFLNKIIGTALAMPGSNNSKLNVSFFGKPSAMNSNYWIIELDEDYSYAVVSDPTRSTLFILSRNSAMDPVKYDAIVERMQNLGFNIRKLKKTKQQNCL